MSFWAKRVAIKKRSGRRPPKAIGINETHTTKNVDSESPQFPRGEMWLAWIQSIHHWFQAIHHWSHRLRRRLQLPSGLLKVHHHQAAKRTLQLEVCEARCLLSGTPFAPAEDLPVEDRSDSWEFAAIPAYTNGKLRYADQGSEFPYGKQSTFLLESNPNASKTIYLDFNGHHSVNNGWEHDIVFPAFDRDDNPNSFSDSELSEIQKQFLHVAEDFLPFDINVTTKDPGVDDLRKSGPADDRWGIRAVNTQATDGFGDGIGGWASPNSFSFSLDAPAFVFNKGIMSGGMTNSHEIGHTLGLDHDGLNGSDYHPGIGNGETAWGPIMGAAYGKNLVQWSNGDYSGSTTKEDDLALITQSANGFGYRNDDHGNNRGAATEMTLDSEFHIQSWGIIERRSDLDYFSFDTGPGAISISINPPIANPSLDVQARLLDSSGKEVAKSNPVDLVSASFDLSLPEGTYFLEIDGVGKPGVYSDYGSLGFYEIEGVVTDPINDLPTINSISSQFLTEDDGGKTVRLAGITAGGNESQPLRVTATSSQTGLLPHPTVSYSTPDREGTLFLQSVNGQSGSAIVTVKLEDGGPDHNLETSADNAFVIKTFSVVVEAENDPPTLNEISNIVLEEDAPQQSILLVGISDGDQGDQPLRVTASSSLVGLISSDGLIIKPGSPTAELRFQPAPNQYGVTTITVQVEDGGLDQNLATQSDNAVFSRSFQVSVLPVNDPPGIMPVDSLTIFDQGPKTVLLRGVHAGENEIQPLKVTAMSNNPAVISSVDVEFNPSESISRLHLFSVPGSFGIADISVRVEDGGLDGILSTVGDNSFKVITFKVSVDPENDTPDFVVPTQLRFDRARVDNRIEISQVTAGLDEFQPLQFSVVNADSDLFTGVEVFYNSPENVGYLVFTTLDEALGQGLIELTLEDGGTDGDLATSEDNLIQTRTIAVMITANRVVFADAEATINGLVEGTYRDTYWKNPVSQDISETAFRQGSASRLLHRWRLNVAAADRYVKFSVFASHDSENEQFQFEYKVAGTGTWKALLTTTQNAGKPYSSVIRDPELMAGGFVWVRVQDTDRGLDSHLATIQIAKLQFSSNLFSEMHHAVNVFVIQPNVAEGSTQKGQFRFQLADRYHLEQDLEVFYRVDGSADASDYRQILRGKTTIKAGNFMSRQLISAWDDSEFEGTESITLQLIPRSEYRIVGDATASLQIKDNDRPTYEAIGEVTNLGRHSGDLSGTFFEDSENELLTESEIRGQKMLEHRWKFDLSGNQQVTFRGRFDVITGSDQDDFQLVYSTDEDSWESLGRLTPEAGGVEIVKPIALPDGVDDVWVRIFDRYRESDDEFLSVIAVDLVRFEN